MLNTRPDLFHQDNRALPAIRQVQRHYLVVSKIFTVFWGIFTVAFAFVVPFISDTVIEAINKVGSLHYGPIFAAFFLGIFTRWATPVGVKVGVTVGILLNLYLWLGVPQLSWLWWNAIGMLMAVLTAFVVSRTWPREAETVALDPPEPAQINWPLRYVLLVVYFFGIIGLCAWLQVNALS